MINKLTNEQRDKIPEYIEFYKNIVKQPTDEVVARDTITQLWSRMGYSKPIIIVSDNPIHAILKTFIFRQTRGSELRSELDRELDRGLDNELRRELDRGLSRGLDRELDRGLSSELRSELHRELRRELRSELDSELRRELHGELGIELGNFSNWYVSTWWVSWLGYYKYAEMLGVKFNIEKLQLFYNYLTNIQFIIPYKNIVFISRNFTNTTRNIAGQLHNEEGPAIQFKGWGIHMLYGVRIDRWNFKKLMDGSTTISDVMNIENTEERYAILRYKPDLLLKTATLVDEKVNTIAVKKVFYKNKLYTLAGRIVRHGDIIFKADVAPDISSLFKDVEVEKRERVNRLYSIDNELFDSTKYFIQKKCPSTDRVYYEWIPNEIAEFKNADHAVAWQCHLTVEEYQLELTAEA